MILQATDPDIETIKNRIDRRQWNLQPDFQRGEVWPESKKMRLIDSILRNWHIPPIHVIDNEKTKTIEVLDGQQRLVSIRDFLDNKFCIDGTIEPFDKKIHNLNGLCFRDLNDEEKARFLGYSIRVFTISKYVSGEPAELFYRLNQPSNLTSAEKRNAFFGPVRDQIKELKSIFDRESVSTILGFSNSRMAYEDILAKVAVAIEEQNLSNTTSASNIAERFRQSQPINDDKYNLTKNGVELFTSACVSLSKGVKFNKASMFSWILFAANVNHKKTKISVSNFSAFLNRFESERIAIKTKSMGEVKTLSKYTKLNPKLQVELLEMFTDRAASRSSNISSILLRDLIIGIFAVSSTQGLNVGRRYLRLKNIVHVLESRSDSFDLEKILLTFAEENKWSYINEV